MSFPETTKAFNQKALLELKKPSLRGLFKLVARARFELATFGL
jgi:hypothetical protein